MPGLSEFELIETLLKPLAVNAPGAFALADDAAIMPEPLEGHVLVITKDALAVGSHMLFDDPPGDMARKALRVNLSDLASMGASPVGFFMALCIGRDTKDRFLKEFISGLAEDVDRFSIPLMGGDIIRQDGPFIVTITAVGSVKREDVLRRSHAEPGDSLWVSGTVGDGALGLLSARGQLGTLSARSQAFLSNRYRVPQPRVETGLFLAGLVSACTDVSDGLLADVDHICKASGVGCRIEQDAIPLSPAAKEVVQSNKGLWQTILTGGDDYELAFAVPAARGAAITDLMRTGPIQLTRIGIFEPGSGTTLVRADGVGVHWEQLGFQHE
jgi:thiamine-monophosphate kinase